VSLLMPLIWKWSISRLTQIEGVYMKAAEHSIKLVHSYGDHEVIDSHNLDSPNPSFRPNERRILRGGAIEKYGPAQATIALSNSSGSVQVHIGPARTMLQDFMNPRAFLWGQSSRFYRLSLR
jgi:hypothetical protein